MHPDNPYRHEYDLPRYIQQLPELASYCKKKHGRLTVDFASPDAVIALNKAIIEADCGVVGWTVPKGNLCPPIPGRIDYLLHIKSLLSDTHGPIKMLDIGTGATAIYGVLAATQFDYQVVGTDISQHSLSHAEKMLAANPSLASKVTLRHQPSASHIFHGVVNDTEQFDISVCNPPFYKSSQQANEKNREKNRALASKQTDRNFAGQDNELIYPGGEVAFIKRMIFESYKYRNQITWFTSLVSQKSSVDEIKRTLKKERHAVQQWITMKHGNKTSRIVVWQFIAES